MGWEKREGGGAPSPGTILGCQGQRSPCLVAAEPSWVKGVSGDRHRAHGREEKKVPRAPGPSEAARRTTAEPQGPAAGRQGSCSGADGLGLPSGATAARGAQSHGHRAPGASLPETLGALSTGARSGRVAPCVPASPPERPRTISRDRSRRCPSSSTASAGPSWAARQGQSEAGLQPQGPEDRQGWGWAAPRGSQAGGSPGPSRSLCSDCITGVGACCWFWGAGLPELLPSEFTARPHLEQTPRPGCCTC